MDALTPAEADDENARCTDLRKAPRDSMLLLAAMRRPDGPEVQVKVRNLSSGGMMAETPSGFLRGEAVEITLRGIGLVTGSIAWAAPGKVGVTFDGPIDPKLARKPVAGGASATAIRTAMAMWRPELR